MKILVCFKIVPDYEEVPEADWEDVRNLNTDYVKKIYGCFDEAALETALCLKDGLIGLGEEASCIAITAGTGPKALFTGLYAAGFDQVIRIDTEAEEFCTKKTAGRLAACIRRIQPDVVFTGRQTGASGSGMMAAYLASYLSCPWISEVVELYPDRSGVLLAVCENEETSLVQKAVTPMVASVGNAKKSCLRLFSLKARLEAAKKTVLVETPDEAETAGGEEVVGREEVRPSELTAKKRNRDCRMVENREHGRQAEVLFELLTGRRTDI